MFRDLWNKLAGKGSAAAEKRETELEEMSSGERHFAEQSVDDIAADALTKEHLGGFDSTPPGSDI
jgi:hypothetical protein